MRDPEGVATNDVPQNTPQASIPLMLLTTEARYFDEQDGQQELFQCALKGFTLLFLVSFRWPQYVHFPVSEFATRPIRQADQV